MFGLHLQSLYGLVESYRFEYAPTQGVTKIIESGVVKEADNPLKFFSNLKNDDLDGFDGRCSGGSA